MNNYDPSKIEKKWQKRWQEDDLYKTSDEINGKENFYALVEFPYPSGNLHIGHWYAFAVPDIFVRFKRMMGFNAMFPIGFDAFGLPAENAAIKHKINPRKWTYENIAYMEKQIQSMGNSFDWSRKVITSDPEYYKWTQWLFLQLYKKGLAYKNKATVNWCPSCNTVLANEQVTSGKCERCDSEVIQKDLEQWFFKITDYAERLISDLDTVDYSDSIKESQKNWIGKSEGTELEFEIKDSKEKIKVFTTRADTLFGVTYIVLAPEHELILKLKSQILNIEKIEKYKEEARSKTEIERTNAKKEKTGVKIEGITVINPANGEKIPIFMADYVLGSYGTGAVMAVPAHDDRDLAFAKRYSLPIKRVIRDIDQTTNLKAYEKVSIKAMIETGFAWTYDGILMNSGEFNGMESEEAIKEITKKFGKKVVKYKLRDWLLSRQRYWGCPIPIVYDPEGKVHIVPEKNLPWLLPEDVDFTPGETSPLVTSKELKERVEKIFGKGWTPEYDTMDTFVDSSWYFLRYTDPKNKEEFANKEKMKKWLPVKRYSGGAEHTTMHLLYSRFFHKALFDLNLTNESEPFWKRMNRGLILGPDSQKMSKSKGNVIDPDEQVKKLGSDTVKMYLAFIGPYSETGQYPWDLGGVVGIRRFLEKVWTNFSQEHGFIQLSPLTEKDQEVRFNQMIKKITEDIEQFKFNTAISEFMKFIGTNGLFRERQEDQKRVRENFLKILAPFAPHMTEELWHQMGHKDSIHLEKWPRYDPKKVVEEKVNIMVQVNGKIRAQFEASPDIEESEAKTRALALPEAQKWLQSQTPKKVIFVPSKIINFVV